MRVGRAAGWLALVVAAALAGLAMLPLAPPLLEPQLDNSFAAVLHHAAAQPPAQRPRLISTYGPLGFSQASLYLPETFGRMLALRAVSAVALCAAVGWLGWAAWRSPWGGAAALAVAAPLAGGGDARFFLLLGLLPLLALARPWPPPPIRLTVGVALGLAALTKVTCLIAAAVVLPPLALAELLARRLPMAALAALLTVAVGWWWSGEDAGAAVAYLDWSLREIVPGYSQAMPLRTTPTLVWHAAAVSAALWIWIAALAWRRRRRGWWAAPLAAAPLLLLQFKAGFVRADVHVFTTAFALLAEGTWLALLLGRRPAALAAGAMLVAALPGALLWHAWTGAGAPVGLFRLVTPAELARRATALPAMWRGEILAPAHARRVHELHGSLPLPAFDGGVDMFGHDQSRLVAAGVPYRPRPVFQGYMAYTARLAAENATCLASPDAPRWILFDPQSIDGRFPAIDDAAAWPELLSRYRPAGAVGRYALLERRERPRPWRLVPLAGADTTSDTPIAVPAGDGAPIWARIAVGETPGDHLQALLLAAPYVHLDVVLPTNAVWRARLVPAVARAGFLLSPVIATPAALASLAEHGAGALADQAVHTINVRVTDPLTGAALARPVRVEFLRLSIDAG